MFLCLEGLSKLFLEVERKVLCRNMIHLWFLSLQGTSGKDKILERLTTITFIRIAH
jgi:hypothetical protein